MADPDAFVPLGIVTDYEGKELKVYRDYDALDLSHVGALLPAGVAELEQRIAEYRQQLACYRLRTADLSGIDLDECRDDIITWPGIGDPADLSGIDWLEVGRRLKAMERYGGYGELRRLHALLTGTETPKEAE